MSTTPPEDPWGRPSSGGDEPPPPPPGGYPPPPPSWQQPPPAGGGYGAPGGNYPPPPPSWQQPEGAYYGGEPRPGGAGGMLSGWWQRVGASVIDFLVMLIPFIIVGALTHQNTGNGQTFQVNYAGGFVIDLVWIVYTGLMVGSGGQTVGNKAVHTRVVDGRTGGRVSMGRAFGRALAQAVALQLFVIPWILDCLWPLWDRDHQTLHDKVASTVVLQT